MRILNRVTLVGLALVACFATAYASSENTNPRFGKWKLKSDNPAPYLNIMTYEPYGEKGMRITIEATIQGESKTTATATDLNVIYLQRLNWVAIVKATLGIPVAKY